METDPVQTLQHPEGVQPQSDGAWVLGRRRAEQPEKQLLQLPNVEPDWLLRDLHLLQLLQLLRLLEMEPDWLLEHGLPVSLLTWAGSRGDEGGQTLRGELVNLLQLQVRTLDRVSGLRHLGHSEALDCV